MDVRHIKRNMNNCIELESDLPTDTTTLDRIVCNNHNGQNQWSQSVFLYLILPLCVVFFLVLYSFARGAFELYKCLSESVPKMEQSNKNRLTGQILRIFHRWISNVG